MKFGIENSFWFFGVASLEDTIPKRKRIARISEQIDTSSDKEEESIIVKNVEEHGTAGLSFV